MTPAPDSTEKSVPSPGEEFHDERLRGIREFVREAWSQALVAVNTAEDDVQKLVSRVGGWVEMGPEEGRKLVVELTERLRTERDQLEKGVEAAVNKALAPVGIPSRDDLADIHARVSVIEARIDRLAARRAKARK